MAKIDKFTQARNDGLARALQIVETEGIDALKKEVAFRRAIPVQFELKRKVAEQMLSESLKRMFGTLTTVTYKCLHDEFGFGKERLQKAEARITKDCEEIASVDPYGYRYLTFADIAKEYNKLYGLHINEDAVVESDKMNEREMDLRMTVNSFYLWLGQMKHYDAQRDFYEWFGDRITVEKEAV